MTADLSITAAKIAAIGRAAAPAIQGISASMTALGAAWSSRLTNGPDFEHAMRRVAQITQATPDDLTRLRDAAQNTPRAAGSPADAAQAIVTLASAGLTVDEILTTGLRDVSALAMRSGLDMVPSARAGVAARHFPR